MRSPFLSRLADSGSVTHGIATTAVIGGLSLLSPRRLSPTKRLAYRLANGAIAAWMTVAEFRSHGRGVLSRGAAAGAVVGITGLTIGLSEASEAIDERIQQRLEKRGVSHPRVWIAAASVVFAAASWALGAISARRGSRETIWMDGDDEILALTHVPHDVRSLTEALLGTTSSYGAPALRQQLASARVSADDVAQHDRLSVTFVVSSGTDLAVPHDGVFPHAGQFSDGDGNTMLVRLTVTAGQLDTLFVESADGENVDATTFLPAADTITLVAETPYGFEPVTEDR
ncbi:hypothetical protein [Microbacterium amylolyticum]|uniref:Uncharacterized protein n=1 Tax=Microbacterium amylolyticum TaxID=936337 RepID=A0ABS4ZFJ8_9MICO|nr:hypothetical protein [Microbacterium amylolyticum]MBP2436044.1 hypothetical protein [Microbacterium amylolyticum]